MVRRDALADLVGEEMTPKKKEQLEAIEEARRERKIVDKAQKCMMCAHYGPFVHYTRHKNDGPKNVDVHECAIHPGCMNTMYSLACRDWTQRAW